MRLFLLLLLGEIKRREDDVWSLAVEGCAGTGDGCLVSGGQKGHGRSVGLEAGTNLDSRSSVLGSDRGGLVKNMMNKRQGEEEATVLPDRPPPEPPPWSAGASRVWKHLFNFTFCL
ncbi:unnamed protein product [Cuscuta epithymum]|uniref:Uncharacterized protein n=1 Tax=Cuscuta epithymum TaxID=186058 RepID=A0AAV0DAC7_9ASTE|nr:unnamed protein product [Cuscuta epithymum]